MALRGTTVEQKIWNYFKDRGLNDFGCAGLMGNLYAESALNPKNLQNSYEKKLKYTDDTYTQVVDNGKYKNFVKDSAGYGLAQWTYWSRKQALLEFAKAMGKSIGDLEMQLDFLYQELSTGYKKVLKTLTNATSVLDASNSVLLEFERPADQSKAMQKKRASYGEGYYAKYAIKEDESMAEIKLDNTPDVWAKEAVDWAVKNKILFGDENGNYKLHSACTRQEMLVFLDRVYGLVK
ncbi:MAG: S-layer homology domain-containing protein [Clostridia bacterium]|nr:S-layer homology domain-containing protein [Clostridia bacterium]